MVPDFQKAVGSLYIQKNVDLYLTGSNAYLLSGELATFLSGRYVEINLLPLSFAEYAEIKGKSDDAAFAEYITSSGRKVSQTTVSDYVEALIESYIFYPAERFDVVGKQLLKQE